MAKITFEFMYEVHRGFINNKETTKEQLMKLRQEMVKANTEMSSYQDLIDLIDSRL